MPKSYLVLFNIAKQSNLGNLIRTADALGVSEVLIIGRKRYRTLGAFGTHHSLKQVHFYSLPEAVTYLRDKGVKIVAVEIHSEAENIEAEPFQGDTAFLLGNEGTGLNEDQLNSCDQIVYISQYGSGASLNVNVACGIVLHRFSSWANIEENSIRDQKFISKIDHPDESS